MQYFLVRIEIDSTCFARLDVVAYGAPFLRMLHSLGREIRGYLAKSGRVGSYGTRNVIEIIESWFWELSTDFPVLCLCLSSILRGIPFSWGSRLALPFLPMSCF